MPTPAATTSSEIHCDASLQAMGERWYHSDLPPPPGYVSTSQWISLLVVAAGVGILLLARRLNVPGYTEAVANAVPAEASS